ncbi:glycoporin [Enterobacter cancerogenus]|uniref:Glycoporin n=1 Tax=Enterobacter cancerogenus TaxID=69218 RepID=A0A484W879_9ENTR|nr:glycoporin [Enterobacter cancerogenus]
MLRTKQISPAPSTGCGRNVELGYIYAHNEIDQFNTSTFDAECENDCWITDPGEYDIHTIHASYLIPNVMKMKNFQYLPRGLCVMGERQSERGRRQ